MTVAYVWTGRQTSVNFADPTTRRLRAQAQTWCNYYRKFVFTVLSSSQTKAIRLGLPKLNKNRPIWSKSVAFNVWCGRRQSDRFGPNRSVFVQLRQPYRYFYVKSPASSYIKLRSLMALARAQAHELAGKHPATSLILRVVTNRYVHTVHFDWVVPRSEWPFHTWYHCCLLNTILAQTR
jgi:hypothetical protein